MDRDSEADTGVRQEPAGGTDAKARTRLYQDGVLVRENFPVEDVSDYVGTPGAAVWVDLLAPGVDDLAVVADELGLHQLAVADAVGTRQRPKLDRYSTHDFLNMYAIGLDAATGSLRQSELSAFITPRALVTVRKDEAFDIDDVVRRWDGSPDLARFGVGFLLYALIDHVVDGHFETVQELDEQIDQLEDMLFAEGTGNEELQRRSFALRKSLVTLRRVVLPMREVVNTLMRRDLQVVSDEMAPYYQDVYDHVLRATEWTESLRDLVATILETNLTLQGNRLNVITKKVTSWAAIIAVPTAITGWYGQNLPYPGFADRSGLIASVVLIVAVSGALYVTFRRKDWL
ncbi:MAG TPA: magnesium transporter CorA family protein [Propionibacteriaceae bacterium]|nr:magnesium transporter CorA family protein [Propionibacteriaceae bacterium]